VKIGTKGTKMVRKQARLLLILSTKMVRKWYENGTKMECLLISINQNGTKLVRNHFAFSWMIHYIHLYSTSTKMVRK
jgi:hypothetical protein